MGYNWRATRERLSYKEEHNGKMLEKISSFIQFPHITIKWKFFINLKA